MRSWSTSRNPATTDPRSRRLGDERARYGRKRPREQVDDVVGWIRAHRIATLVAVLFFAVGALLWAARGSQVEIGELAVGDCLYVRAVADQTSDRPIGQPHDVAGALLDDGAERASCTASHGHEVSAVLDLTRLHYTLAESQVACEDVFDTYVGHEPAGSIYAAFPALPDDGAQAAGQHVGVCLVARADGQWMDHPARGSGE